jgi:hypothetical protein
MVTYKFLCVGHDSATLASASALLASAGHSLTVATPYWAMMLLRREHFDAVVLCGTLANWEDRLLRFQIDSLGRNLPVVDLCSPDPMQESDLASPAGNPNEFVSVVLAALEEPGASASA